MSFCINAIIGLVTIFVFLYCYFTRNFSYWKNKNVYFPKPLPFVGNMAGGIMMRESVGELFKNLYRATSGPLVGFFILDRPCLLLRDPRIIKDVLLKDFQFFFDRNIANNMRDDPISTHMLFVLRNPDWKEIRSKITPVFTSAKLKAMFKLIEDSGNELVNYVRDAIKKHQPMIETKDLSRKFTVNVITSVAFGVNVDSFKDENSQFKKIAEELFDWGDLKQAFQMRCYFTYPDLVKLFRMTLLKASCTKFLKDNFLKIMEERKKSKIVRNDLIDILLEIDADKEFLDKDILVSQAVIFFAGGFETTSSVISFTLYELACNIEIQEKLREEIKQVSAKHEGRFNYEAIKEMKYFDMCVKESLRKYPILPFLDRECNIDYKIPGTDVVLEKGTPVFISTLGLHHDPDYFPNPDKFDPERWASSDDHQVENCTYLPLGDGPRKCIGGRFGFLNAKVGLGLIIKNFKVDLCEKTPREIMLEPHCITLANKGAMILKFSEII